MGTDLDQAADYASKSLDELYASIVPEAERVAGVYAKGTLVLRGKEVFRATWARLSGVVCPFYAAHTQSISNQVDLITLVATPLLGNPELRGISVVAFAALAVKIGVHELCGDADRNGKP